MPWLFHGFFTRYWPFIVMFLAFVGVGLAELFRRQRRLVLPGQLLGIKQGPVILGPLVPAEPVDHRPAVVGVIMARPEPRQKVCGHNRHLDSGQ